MENGTELIEATGDAIGVIVDGTKKFPLLATKYLTQFGIYTPSAKAPIFDRNAWYPRQSWLAAFGAIARELGDSALVGVGENVPKHLPFPPSINNVESALRSIDVAYHMAHRKNGIPMFDKATGRMSEGIGHYGCTLVAPRDMKICCDEPYPCAFDLGIISGMAKRFDPRATIFHVEGSCRSKGGQACVYRVQW